MKINNDKIKSKLKHVPVEDRVFIYDASILLEFLKATFMPTEYFLKDPKEVYRKAAQLEENDYIESKPHVSRMYGRRQQELFDWYLLYRQNKDYTADTETRFQFNVILNKLRFHKNNFELIRYRVGGDQIVYFGPLMPRREAPLDARNKWPVPEKTKIETVEVEHEDLAGEEDPLIPEEIIPVREEVFPENDVIEVPQNKKDAFLDEF